MGRRGGGGGGGALRSAPRARTPPTKPAPKAPAPVPASAGGHSNVISALAYNIVDGITRGAGNAMGHRFVEFFAGPRTIQVVSSEPQAATAADSSLDSCGAHNKAFANCLNHSQSDISRCQFYLDLLNQCHRGSSNAGLAAATTIS
ncbi:hypothetical protein VPH35_094900 [Triticum aestivum]|uniref:coiled-coil-helix-coiled-coil-helix domain-containing protein 2 n=1 Tax=Triticum aestivum TaxID=4565 RepID=UPI0008425167|nr:coiled-coil-helix-coiled-coil-helix domain-containing protein 2-like [Triticum aestivum]